jgi:endoglucanase
MDVKSTLATLLLLLGFSDDIRAQEVSLTPSSPAASLPSYLVGVNLAGAEYAPGPTGVVGRNYTYPTTNEFNYYKSKGFSVVRLPFDIARLQPVNQNALNQSELARITAAVEYARKIGMYVILDPHNYGKMWSQASNSYQLIYVSSYVPNGYFADFWRRLSTIYAKYPNVIYGLMNEPNEHNPAQWKAAAVAAVNAIRTVTATQTILIPGTFFSTAATWTQNGNSSVWTGYKDPVGGPFMFEMHQYLDANYSGASSTCVSGSGSTVLSEATKWLAANNFKGFLGEFDWYNDFGQKGGTVSPECQTEGKALLQALQNSVWGGWTWWGSGPWAWNNGVNLDPGANGIAGDQPQMAALTAFIPKETNSGVIKQTLGSLRNNFTGRVGFSFTVDGSPITVTALGRWILPGNSQTHTLYLADASTGQTLATATINASGKSVGFNYVALSSNVVLNANKQYIIASSEMNGGDTWYNDNTIISLRPGVTLNYSNWYDSSYHNNIAGHSYVPVSFLIKR